MATNQESASPLDRIPYGCSDRLVIDHPEGGTVSVPCGLCPGCLNKEALEYEALEAA